MAINPDLIETKTIPQLPDLALALENFFAHSGDNGIAGKASINQLVAIIQANVPSLDSSPFVPNTGSPLPNPIDKPTAITFVGAGTFDQTTGADVVTTEELNVLFWSSNLTTGTWTIGVAINIDLSGYVSDSDIAYKSIVGKNLFNKATVISNISFNPTNPNTETSNTGSKAIKNINVEGIKSITVAGRTNGTVLAPRLGDRTLLPNVYGTNYGSGPSNGIYSLPDGAVLVDMQIQVGTSAPADLDMIQVEAGVEATSVEPYSVTLLIETINGKKFNYIFNEDIETTPILGKNVFNYESDILFGTTMPNVAYSGQTDIIIKDIDSACTRLLPVKDADAITIQGRLINVRGFAFYDVDKKIMPPVTGTLYWDVLANTTISVPDGAVYFRFQTAFNNNTTWVDDAKLIMVEFSASQSVFEPYEEKNYVSKLGDNYITLPSESSSNSERVFVNNAVSYVGDVLTVISRYSDSENIKRVMKRHLKNNSFLIESIKLIPFTGNITLNDFNSLPTKVILDASITDVISPYQIDDGYELTSAPFISGNHGYGSVPTASLLFYDLFADGVKMITDNYYDAKIITAKTEAEVYSYSGQAESIPANDVVFNEYHNYNLLSNGQISVVVEIDMIQAIPFTLMYAIQGIQGGSEMTKIYVPRSGRNTIEAFALGVNEAFGTQATTPTVDRCILMDEDCVDGIIYWLDLSVGLGSNKSVEPTTASILKSPSNKIYHRTIDIDTPITTTVGYKMYYNGGFIPFRNLLSAPNISYLMNNKGTIELHFHFASVSTTSTSHFIYHPDIIGKTLTLISKDVTLTIDDYFATTKGLKIISTGYGNAILKLS